MTTRGPNLRFLAGSLVVLLVACVQPKTTPLATEPSADGGGAEVAAPPPVGSGAPDAAAVPEPPGRPVDAAPPDLAPAVDLASAPDLAPDLPPPSQPTVAALPARNAPVRLPAGTKVTCHADGGGPSDTCAVLTWDGYTYWPLSHDDNRIELDIVAFDGNGVVVKEVAARGTRYIEKITLDRTARTASFQGQDEGTIYTPNRTVTLSWDLLKVAR